MKNKFIAVLFITILCFAFIGCADESNNASEDDILYSTTIFNSNDSPMEISISIPKLLGVDWIEDNISAGDGITINDKNSKVFIELYASMKEDPPIFSNFDEYTAFANSSYLPDFIECEKVSACDIDFPKGCKDGHALSFVSNEDYSENPIDGMYAHFETKYCYYTLVVCTYNNIYTMNQKYFNSILKSLEE